MKISKEVKRAVKNNNVTKFYIDYDPETKQFSVSEFNLEGKSIPELIKGGFNDNKIIISKKKDEISKIFHSKDGANEIALLFNEKLKNEEIIIIECKECGRYFYMTSEEVSWYNQNNYKLPKRDKLCRLKKKNESKEK